MCFSCSCESNTHFYKIHVHSQSYILHTKSLSYYYAFFFSISTVSKSCESKRPENWKIKISNSLINRSGKIFYPRFKKKIGTLEFVPKVMPNPTKQQRTTVRPTSANFFKSSCKRLEAFTLLYYQVITWDFRSYSGRGPARELCGVQANTVRCYRRVRTTVLQPWPSW